ncbi:MAG TPA: 4-hydroxyphenyl-beta-ketoacyl-CoA hydrolase, partial [Candidatus Dormibacteraeota bacterium]|nr:4-hydroxyphenyl-beta-ketoacyl-CoA hydrolase [Candidatus Dormibacteraeota bacterium]
RWMADFAKIQIKDEVRPLILKENAMRLFGFTSKQAATK